MMGQNEAGYQCVAVALQPVGIPVFHERANMHYVMFCNNCWSIIIYGSPV